MRIAATAAVLPRAPNSARITSRTSTAPEGRPRSRPALKPEPAVAGFVTSQAAVSPRTQPAYAGTVSTVRPQPAAFQPCLFGPEKRARPPTAKADPQATARGYGQKIGLGLRPNPEAAKQAAARSAPTPASTQELCGTAKASARRKRPAQARPSRLAKAL